MPKRIYTEAQRLRRQAYDRARERVRRPRTETERARSRAYYKATKARRETPEGKAQIARWVKRNAPKKALHASQKRVQLQSFVDKLKDNPCMDCGGRFLPYVMDFDHRHGQKVASVAQLVSQLTPIARILAEIAKCDLVCANCHRVRTHDDQIAKALKRRAPAGTRATYVIEGFED